MELALSYSLPAVDVQSFIVHNCSVIPESIFLFVTQRSAPINTLFLRRKHFYYKDH